MEYSELRPSDSPLSGEITTLRFPKNVMPTFNHYSGTSDPILHLRQYEDKTAIYAYATFLVKRSRPVSKEPPTTGFTRSQRIHSEFFMT